VVGCLRLARERIECNAILELYGNECGTMLMRRVNVIWILILILILIAMRIAIARNVCARGEGSIGIVSCE